MAARTIRRLNFQPHIMGPVYFISHDAPPFFVVNPARTAVEPFLVSILKSKEDAREKKLSGCFKYNFDIIEYYFKLGFACRQAGI